MKVDKMKLANTFALTVVILWVICTAAIWLFPNFSLVTLNWWMHGVDIVTMTGWNLTIANFLLGGTSVTVSAWVTGYVLAWSWEKINK